MVRGRRVTEGLIDPPPTPGHHPADSPKSPTPGIYHVRPDPGRIGPSGNTEVGMTVQALRRGRPEVLAELLDRYGRDMQAVAYLIVRDRAAAEDIVADSLLAALDHGRSLRDDDALRPWLLRIATNKALRYRQRAAHVVELQVVEGAVAEPRGPTADDSLALWQAVRDLPPRMRAAVGLRYYLDLPVETVAEVLEVSPNTIKTQLKSALGHLRTALADEPMPVAEVRHA